MKYFKTAILLIILTCLFFLMSCDESGNQIISNRDLIAGSEAEGKTWRISTIEVELGALVPKSCLTDNNITYFPGGQYEVNEGSTKCDPTDPPAYTGRWFFNKDETELTVQMGDSVKVWNILQLKSDKHRISSTFVDGQRTYLLDPR